MRIYYFSISLMAYKFQYSDIWQKIVLIHVCLFDHGQIAAATYKLL